MGGEDVRWEQRFSNYKNALNKLLEAVDKNRKEELSDLEKEGLIQRFEYTYELAWKTVQDLLRFKGYTDIAGPTPVLKQAFQDGYITDAKGWSDMKKSRELTSHTYNQDAADGVGEAILVTHHILLTQLANRLEEERYGRQTELFNP